MAHKPGFTPWEQHHSQALTREMIRAILAARSTFYHAPGLDGEVDGNHGNRISQKVVQQCEKMARDAGLDPKIVKEETRKKVGGPSKAKVGNGSPKKKRKVKEESEGMTESD